jgi:hypothetical protein
MGAPAGGRPPTTGSELDLVSAARELADMAAAALRASVAAARDAGRTWQEIGDLLGVSRQAAFQRFGRPADPRTGAEMSASLLPGAGQNAANLIAAWSDARYAEVVAQFDATMTQRLPAAGLGAAWAQVIGTVGEYRGMGEPVVHQAGDYTVADVPLWFEAGEMKGRVAYDADGRVAGLFVVKPDEP